MPRKARIDAPGALHHIMVRGIERKLIFYDDNDRDNFVERLETIITETETFLIGWALMPNHVHLLLRTGKTPLATVMRRLLTGYAVSFNLRHRRHGHLFQNRYKSILCQEDAYLLELVRYIHLNALRKGVVKDINALGKYPYCGHSALMGKVRRDFQDTEYVLRRFGKRLADARKGYLAYVEKGIGQGRRPDLVGGGLIRSAGGWSTLKTMRSERQRIKSDERILGNSDFVESVLKAAEEKYEETHHLKAQGYDIEMAVKRVSDVFGIESDQFMTPGKNPVSVRARSLLCYWVVRKLGYSATELSKRLAISQPAVSISVKRGEKIASDGGFSLLDL